MENPVQMPSPIAALCLALLMSVPLVACEDPVDPGPQPVFDPVELEGWREMRDCRHSHEHELNRIRVVVSPETETPYAELSPDFPYPVGARLVKMEYDDPDCEVLVGYTAMKKLAEGAMPEGGDWLWQRVSTELEVVEEGAPERCVTCHTYHCAPPDLAGHMGFDLTCAEEL